MANGMTTAQRAANTRSLNRAAQSLSAYRSGLASARAGSIANSLRAASRKPIRGSSR